MNTVRKIAFPAVIAGASLFLFANSASAANATPFNEEVVKMGHGFELTRGESVMLAYHHKPETYRICIEEVPGIVPLELTVDGKKMEVVDGTCTDVVGAHISMRPSPKLRRGMEMVGHFEQVKK